MIDFLAALLTPQLFEATVRLATPVTFAALAAVVCERSGVTNIAMEGVMLVGAFFAAWVSHKKKTTKKKNKAARKT